MKKISLLLPLILALIPHTSAADDRIITVARNGGDFSNVIDAIESITDASNITRYVISLGPGIFYLNGQQLVMKPYVSLVGAGKNVTFLQSYRNSTGSISRFSGTQPGCGVIEISENSSVENMTVRNFGTGVGDVACGIETSISGGNDTSTLKDVDIILSGNNELKVGIINSRTIILDTVSVSIDNIGDSIGILGLSNIRANNIDISARSRNGESIGMDLESSAVTISNSSIWAQDYGVKTFPNEIFINIANTDLNAAIAFVENDVSGVDPIFDIRGSTLNNIRSEGVFDFSNNPGTRLTNSSVGSIINDDSNQNCHNVIDTNLALIDC